MDSPTPGLGLHLNRGVALVKPDLDGLGALLAGFLDGLLRGEPPALEAHDHGAHLRPDARLSDCRSMSRLAAARLHRQTSILNCPGPLAITVRRVGSSCPAPSTHPSLASRPHGIGRMAGQRHDPHDLDALQCQPNEGVCAAWAVAPGLGNAHLLCLSLTDTGNPKSSIFMGPNHIVS